jgi:hypothetical protein
MNTLKNKETADDTIRKGAFDGLEGGESQDFFINQ